MKALTYKRPQGFIVEDVKGLAVAKNKKLCDAWLKCLRALGDPKPAYHVGWRVLGTVEHGAPQHGERIHILGIRKGVVVLNMHQTTQCC